MAERRVNCQIAVPDAIADGTPVNAFRAVKDGDEWLLDFLVLSEKDGKAVVVSRVRVTSDFLAAVRSRLDSAMLDGSDVSDNVVPFPRAGGMEVN